MSINQEKIANHSPLNPIESVLTSVPGTEAALGLMMPPRVSLFEEVAHKDGSILAAREDHNRMTTEFDKHGIEVFSMRKIIGKAIAEKNRSGLETPGALLTELKRRAVQLNEHYGIGNLEQVYAELEELLRQDILTMGADAAVAINGVLTNCIDVNGNKMGFDINLPPAANFMFWRDTNHVLGNKMGTHRMFKPIRDQEDALAHIGFNTLGLKYQPVVTTEKHIVDPHTENEHNDVSIEGGDVLTMELNGNRFAMIGQAERTSMAAVESWYRMHKAMFSASGEGLIPAVVTGPDHDTQDQMHLDTHTQQIAPGAIVHCREITQNRQFAVITERNGKIELVDCQIFADWIDHQASDTYEMSKEEQERHAANVLVDGTRTVYVTRDGSPDIEAFLAKHVDEVVRLHMNDLTNLYGGAHCSTSELRTNK